MRAILAFLATAVGLIAWTDFTGRLPDTNHLAMGWTTAIVAGTIGLTLAVSLTVAPWWGAIHDPVWKCEYSLAFDDTSVLLTNHTGGGQIRIPWSNVRVHAESRLTYVLLLQADDDFVFIPKRVLEASEATAVLRRLDQRGIA
jgi:hypothetical protein